MSFLMPAGGATVSGAVDFPLGITGQLARYRADLGVTGTSTVTGWADQIGSRNFAVSSGSAPALVTGAVNGHPIIRFDGVNDYMSESNGSISQPFHVFMIWASPSSTDDDYVMSGVSPTTEQLIQGDGSGDISQGTNKNTVNPGSLGTFGLIGSFFNSGSSYQTLNDDSPVSGDGPIGSPFSGGVTLAASRTPGSFGVNDFAEIVFYTAEVTGGDFTNLKAYFKSRYKLW